MSNSWIDLTPEGRAIVTVKETSPTWAEVRAEVCGGERHLKGVEEPVEERAIQFAALACHQHASDPEVRVLIKLEFPDRIGYANRRITPE